MLWDKALETGVSIIDEQHKSLFDQVDVLLSTEMNGQGKSKIKEILGFLEIYIVKHFHDEESLMNESDYPKKLLHKLMHENYIVEFKKLKNQFEDEGETLNILMMVNKNVVSWLTNHINVHDREFSDYYKKQSNRSAGAK